jgi:hypothetical protein
VPCKTSVKNVARAASTRHLFIRDVKSNNSQIFFTLFIIFIFIVNPTPLLEMIIIDSHIPIILLHYKLGLQY